MECLAAMGDGDTLVVSTFAEFGRRTDAALHVFGWLEQHGHNLVVLDQDIDLRRSADRVHLEVMRYIARLEENVESAKERDEDESI